MSTSDDPARSPADTAPESAPDSLELGEIVGVFGVRGEVRVFLANPASDTLREPRNVTLMMPQGVARPARLVVRPGAGKRLLGRIDGIDTPERAALLKGARIVIARSELPEPEPGEYYVHDLIGLPVFDTTGLSIGALADVIPGAKDIWVIETDQGEELMVASVENVVSVDVPGRRIVVAEGALASE